MADNARRWAARGFETFKLKVGMDGDVAQVLAVREAVGPQARIRVDANGSWPVDTAVERLREMAPLELAEQPVATLEEMAALRARTDVLLSADESVVTPEDAEAAARVCDAATVKLAKVGGPRAAMRIAERIPVYLSSALDGPVGIAAAGHVAQAIDDSGFAHGLATSLLFADTVATRGVHRRGREPPPPRRPGPRSADRRGRACEQAHRARLASRPWTPPTAIRPLPRRWSRSWPAPASRTRACRPARARPRSPWRCGSEPAIRVWTHVDERCAGFFALGIAQQTGAGRWRC